MVTSKGGLFEESFYLFFLEFTILYALYIKQLYRIFMNCLDMSELFDKPVAYKKRDFSFHFSFCSSRGSTEFPGMNLSPQFCII